MCQPVGCLVCTVGVYICVPDYPLFPPTILTALVCVGIVCNNAMLLAHTLVAAATEYATERLPKLAATVLYAIVVDELITRDLAQTHSPSGG